MKPFLTALLIACSLPVLAQQQKASISIEDDDRRLSIQVEATIQGKPVSYNRRFDVTGMSRAQKDALRNRVLDSLGVGQRAPLPLSTTPPPPIVFESGEVVERADEPVTFVCDACTGQIRLEVSGYNFLLTRDAVGKDNRRVFPMTEAMRPGEYRYQYWQNGVLQAGASFTVKSGDQNTVTIR